VLLFPLGTPVAVVIDGRALPAYVRAYVAGGRVFAPVTPLLTDLADRLWFDGDTLVIERDGRRVRVRLAPSFPDQLNGAYVPAGPTLRGLGASVRYDPSAHRLLIFLSKRAVISSPTPAGPTPPATPSAVFTPPPVPTPRPTWTGSPSPRRTALPFPPPQRLRNEHDLSRAAALDALVGFARAGERVTSGDR
jgi:hypothetical protein